MNKFSIKYVDKLSGRQFEFYCAKLMELTLDVTSIKVTQASNDHGADVIARVVGIGLCILQCKHLRNPNKEHLGYRALEDTAAGKAYYHASNGVLVTNSYLPNRLIRNAKRMNLGVVTRPPLNDLIISAGKEYTRQHQIANKQINKLLKDIGKQYKIFLKLKSANNYETLKMALKKYDRELHSTNKKLSSKSLESSNESDND